MGGIHMREQLLSIATCKKEMKKDVFLFREGEEPTHIFLLHSGKVRIGKITPDGKELSFRICKANDFICETPLFYPAAIYSVHAKVIEKGSYSMIPKHTLEQYVLDNPDFNQKFMRQLGIQHQKNQSKFRDLLLHGKKGALYSTLIRLCNSYGMDHDDGIFLNISLTNQELANFCGMSREVVNRLLNELKRQGIITSEKSYIIIRDLDFLRNEIHCDDCPMEICRID